MKASTSLLLYCCHVKRAKIAVASTYFCLICLYNNKCYLCMFNVTIKYLVQRAGVSKYFYERNDNLYSAITHLKTNTNITK